MLVRVAAEPWWQLRTLAARGHVTVTAAGAILGRCCVQVASEA
jgi:hypothetical protein